MTHRYHSKFGALTMGMFYAGRFDLYKNIKSLEELLKVGGVKEIIEDTIEQFGEEATDCTMVEILNEKGNTIRLASCKFRMDEFDLWLITPEGMAIRV